MGIVRKSVKKSSYNTFEYFHFEPKYQSPESPAFTCALASFILKNQQRDLCCNFRDYDLCQEFCFIYLTYADETTLVVIYSFSIWEVTDVKVGLGSTVILSHIKKQILSVCAHASVYVCVCVCVCVECAIYSTYLVFSSIPCITKTKYLKGSHYFLLT